MSTTTRLAEALRALLESGGVFQADAAREALADYDEEATDEGRDDLLQRARDEYACDEVNIDEDALLSIGDGGAWVQAWVWVADETDEEDDA